MIEGRVEGVDRIWFWVYCNKVPLYPTFYLLKEVSGHRFSGSGSEVRGLK